MSVLGGGVSYSTILRPEWATTGSSQKVTPSWQPVGSPGAPGIMPTSSAMG